VADHSLSAGGGAGILDFLMGVTFKTFAHCLDEAERSSLFDLLQINIRHSCFIIAEFHRPFFRVDRKTIA
jgi:hypothetical protein